MKKLLISCFIVIALATVCVLPFVQEAQAIPRSNTRDSLDTLLYNQPTYVSKAATAANDDLFDVDGGPIQIISFLGICTTEMGATTTTIQIDLDADTGWTDYDFSTAVDTAGDSAGTRYTFTNVAESVLTPLELTAGGSNLMSGGGWFCGEGMIEQTAGAQDNTGAVTWYMTYIPLAAGVTVTAQ